MYDVARIYPIFYSTVNLKFFILPRKKHGQRNGKEEEDDEDVRDEKQGDSQESAQAEYDSFLLKNCRASVRLQNVTSVRPRRESVESGATRRVRDHARRLRGDV